MTTDTNLAAQASDCKHPRQATTALGALTGTGWKCRDCGTLISNRPAPDAAQAGDEPLRKATVIFARAEYVECPHCGERVDGWMGNPQGKETTCDECGQKFEVDANADVELDL